MTNSKLGFYVLSHVLLSNGSQEWWYAAETNTVKTNISQCKEGKYNRKKEGHIIKSGVSNWGSRSTNVKIEFLLQ